MTMETDKADTLGHATFGIAVPRRISLNTQHLWEEKR
jgi:hypothetical protein